MSATLFDVCTNCGGSGEVAVKRTYGATTAPCPECSGLSDPSVNTLGPTHRDAPMTSRLAALDAHPRSGSWQARALDEFVKAGRPGLTDYELAVSLGRDNMRGSVAKYRGALRDGGWVEDSGRVRRTDTGSQATVWVLTEKGLRYLRKRR